MSREFEDVVKFFEGFMTESLLEHYQALLFVGPERWPLIWRADAEIIEQILKERGVLPEGGEQ